MGGGNSLPRNDMSRVGFAAPGEYVWIPSALWGQKEKAVPRVRGGTQFCLTILENLNLVELLASGDIAELNFEDPIFTIYTLGGSALIVSKNPWAFP